MHCSRQTAGWGLCAAFAVTVLWFELRPGPPAPQAHLDEVALAEWTARERATRLQKSQSAELKAQLSERLVQSQRQLSDRELVRAVELAVGQGDRERMAASLHQLGIAAIARGDLDSADVWLADALAEYETLEDERSHASVLLDIGRLHMAFRERAQRAAYDYDDLLLARWAVSAGQHAVAENSLKHVVSSSLQLDRYGTAASALSTLFELYRKQGDQVASLDAGQRALALHASAGNLHAARRTFTTLRDAGLSRAGLERAEAELVAGLATFEAETQKLGLVRDYTQLYHQLMARGDPVGAWRYRRQAEELRSSTSRRAMYRRQPDVLVELYRSNRSIDRASSVLRDAETAFTELGMVEEMLQSAALQEDIR